MASKLSQVCANEITQQVILKCEKYFKIVKYVEGNQAPIASDKVFEMMNQIGQILFVSPRKFQPILQQIQMQKINSDSLMNVSKVEYKVEEKKKKTKNHSRRRTNTISHSLPSHGRQRRDSVQLSDDFRSKFQQKQGDSQESKLRQQIQQQQVSQQSIRERYQRQEQVEKKQKEDKKLKHFSYDFNGERMKVESKKRNNFKVNQIEGQPQLPVQKKVRNRIPLLNLQKKKEKIKLPTGTIVETHKVEEVQEKTHVKSKKREKQEQEEKQKQLEEEELKKKIHVEFSGINDLSNELLCKPRVKFSSSQNTTMAKRSNKQYSLIQLKKSLVQNTITREQYKRLKTQELQRSLTSQQESQKKRFSMNTNMTSITKHNNRYLTLEPISSRKSKIIVENSDLKQKILKDIVVQLDKKYEQQKMQREQQRYYRSEPKKLETETTQQTIRTSKIDQYNIDLVNKNVKLNKVVKQLRKTFLKCPTRHLASINKNRERLGIIQRRKRLNNKIQNILRSQQ